MTNATLEPRRKPTFLLEDLIVNAHSTTRRLSVAISRQRRSTNAIAPIGETSSSSVSSRSTRVVKHGLSLPLIFILSVAICIGQAATTLTPPEKEWLPQDLTGEKEWVSHSRTHLAQNPLTLLRDLFNTASIGADASVSSQFIKKYSMATEANVESTAHTFNTTWLDTSFILDNGFTLAGIMAGAFEAYGVWPCRHAVQVLPILLDTSCPDPTTGWMTVMVYNNPVVTTTDNATMYLRPSSRLLCLCPPVCGT